MLYLTVNEKTQEFRTTPDENKSVAVCGRHIRFNNEDVDYAKSSTYIINSALHSGLLELCSCKQCHQPFVGEVGTNLSTCPTHTRRSA